MQRLEAQIIERTEREARLTLLSGGLLTIPTAQLPGGGVGDRMVVQVLTLEESQRSQEVIARTVLNELLNDA
jgi:hypothetical protein